MLRVEDFFGHQQYGIPSGRPVCEDYHPGDEVLIADGVHDARPKVLAADDAAGTVLVASVATPPGGWKLAYEGRPRNRKTPTRRAVPARRLLPPQAQPARHRLLLLGPARQGVGPRPSPLWPPADGQLRRRPRRPRRRRPELDHRQGLRPVARGRTHDHRPPHRPLRCRRARLLLEHLQRAGPGRAVLADQLGRAPAFYDYTTDAILRAFEDRGHDSEKVFIGGLELGGIFGIHLKLQEFLAHCSPRATAKGALPLNAAVADRRLDGKRSRRVEALCRAHGGKGSPCDFVSIHSYNRSETDGRQAHPGQGDGARDRPGVLPRPVGQLARGLPGLDPAARRGGRRQLPGQRLLSDLVRRRRPAPVEPGRGGPALRLRRDDPDGLAAPRELRRHERRDPHPPVR